MLVHLKDSVLNNAVQARVQMPSEVATERARLQVDGRPGLEALLGHSATLTPFYSPAKLPYIATRALLAKNRARKKAATQDRQTDRQIKIR